MTGRSEYMFDTNAFDEILKKIKSKEITYESLSRCSASLNATHVQRNEIDAIPDEKVHKRERIKRLFPLVALVPTVIARYGDGARYGETKYASNEVIQLSKAFQSDMDACEEEKGKKGKGNWADTKIGVTAIIRKCILVTQDGCLRKVGRKHGGETISFEDFYKHCFDNTAAGLLAKQRETV